MPLFVSPGLDFLRKRTAANCPVQKSAIPSGPFFLWGSITPSNLDKWISFLTHVTPCPIFTRRSRSAPPPPFFLYEHIGPFLFTSRPTYQTVCKQATNENGSDSFCVSSQPFPNIRIPFFSFVDFHLSDESHPHSRHNKLEISGTLFFSAKNSALPTPPGQI